MLALSVLAVVFRGRSMSESTITKDDESDPLLPTPLSNFNGDTPYYLPQNDHSLYYCEYFNFPGRVGVIVGFFGSSWHWRRGPSDCVHPGDYLVASLRRYQGKSHTSSAIFLYAAVWFSNHYVSDPFYSIMDIA